MLEKFNNFLEKVTGYNKARGVVQGKRQEWDSNREAKKQAKLDQEQAEREAQLASEEQEKELQRSAEVSRLAGHVKEAFADQGFAEVISAHPDFTPDMVGDETKYTWVLDRYKAYKHSPELEKELLSLYEDELTVGLNMQEMPEDIKTALLAEIKNEILNNPEGVGKLLVDTKRLRHFHTQNAEKEKILSEFGFDTTEQVDKALRAFETLRRAQTDQRLDARKMTPAEQNALIVIGELYHSAEGPADTVEKFNQLFGQGGIERKLADLRPLLSRSSQAEREIGEIKLAIKDTRADILRRSGIAKNLNAVIQQHAESQIGKLVRTRATKSGDVSKLEQAKLKMLDAVGHDSFEQGSNIDFIGDKEKQKKWLEQLNKKIETAVSKRIKELVESNENTNWHKLEDLLKYIFVKKEIGKFKGPELQDWFKTNLNDIYNAMPETIPAEKRRKASLLQVLINHNFRGPSHATNTRPGTPDQATSEPPRIRRVAPSVRRAANTPSARAAK